VKSTMIHLPIQDSEKGFTLLEIIMVLALMVLILGIATIFFSAGGSASRLGAAGRELSATVRYARSLAVTSGRTQFVIIDLESKSYGMAERDFRPIPRDIQMKVIDPFYGEIYRGRYPFRLQSTGAIEGGTVVLWKDRKSVILQMDPVVGVITTKQSEERR